MAVARVQPLFIRPGQAPEAFGISRATLYRWAEQGKVKIYKRGSSSFVSVEEVSNFIVGDQMGDQPNEDRKS